MSFDPEAHRRSSLEGWEAAASGWVRRRDLVRELGEPVSRWMLDAIDPQPGEHVLELAAGLGETGMLAAERVAPSGSVVISDQAEAMLAGAREHASELGLDNVEFKVLNAEWIDLPLASVDAALCRWGYMLMADPATALGETRRVLRPGGRLALAVWDSVQGNPWALLPAQELRERGLVPAEDPRGRRPRARSRSAARSGSASCSATRASPRGAWRRSSWPAGTTASTSCGRRPSTSPACSTMRCSPVPQGEIEEIRESLARALCAVHRPRRLARDPRSHARRLRERVSGAAGRLPPRPVG